MLKNKKRNFIIILTIAFIIMYFSFKNDYKNIIELFSNMNYTWLIVAIIAVALYQFLEMIYMMYYCRYYRKDYTFKESFDVQQTATFFSAITPSSSGGQFAAILLLNKQGFSSNVGASMMMLSFISWQIVLVLFSATVLIFNYTKMIDIYSSIINFVFIGFTLDTAVITGLFLMSFSKKFHGFIFNKIIPLLGKIRIVKDVEKRKKDTQEWLHLFRTEFSRVLVHKDIMARRLITDIVKIIVIYTVPFLAAKALNIDVSFNQLGFSIVLSSFVYMMSSFIPLPGAAGGAEGVFMLLFGHIFGVGTTAVMLLWRTITYYLPMFFSFVVFANVKELKK